jgi:hypothetical protein
VVDKGVDTFSEMIKEVNKQAVARINSEIDCQQVVQARSGSLPKHVIFYRDGVGEGMYSAVF